jgi:hypothetical protein
MTLHELDEFIRREASRDKWDRFWRVRRVMGYDMPYNLESVRRETQNCIDTDDDRDPD